MYRRGFDAGGLVVSLGSSGLVRVTDVRLNGMSVEPSFGSGVKLRPPDLEVFRVKYERYGAEDRLHRFAGSNDETERDDRSPVGIVHEVVR